MLWMNVGERKWREECKFNSVVIHGQQIKDLNECGQLGSSVMTANKIIKCQMT